MGLEGRQFIFSREGKGECVIIVGSTLEADISSAKWLANKVKDISKADVAVTQEGDKAGNLKKILVGTLLESPGLRRTLETERVLLGHHHPDVKEYALDEGSRSLRENRVDVARAGSLRNEFLCPEDLKEQGFIVYAPDGNTLVLCGGSPRGTFYAVQTLSNRLYMEDRCLKVKHLHTAGFPVLNQPAIPCRGICTNLGGPDHIGRNQWAKEWQKAGEYDYKGFIDWLAQFKITHLNVWLLELSFGIAYPSEKWPECVNRHHPNVKSEFLGEMIEYAHRRFINVSTFIDFPDMFAGILRHHPELGAKQFNPSKLPPQEDWEAFQKTGENKKGHNFRDEFGIVCASNPRVMRFWETYLEEVFSRYPGLDGILGQFSEDVDTGSVCTCENCQNEFLNLQWKYFKRMAEVAQKDRPDRVIYNCASPGDVEILRHRNEIRNFVALDWGGVYPHYVYANSVIHGDWALFHYGVGGGWFGHKADPRRWNEYDWKRNAKCVVDSGCAGISMRGVCYKPHMNDYFAFGEFAWNPDVRTEDHAANYVKLLLRRRDEFTESLYSRWIRAREYAFPLHFLEHFGKRGDPVTAGPLDEEYPRLLKQELDTIEEMLKEQPERNALSAAIEASLETYGKQWRDLLARAHQ